MTTSLTAAQRQLLNVYQQGYRVAEDGRVLTPGGEYLVGTLIKGYRRILGEVMVHRLAGYQKYGDAMLAPGICIRHLDSNPLNNRLSNLAIGTASDNMMDKPPAQRLWIARQASAAQKKLSPAQVADLRARRSQGANYAELQKIFGLSKSTVSYIVNGKTYSEGSTPSFKV